MNRNEKYNFQPDGVFNVDALVKSNGNWRVVYVYNNWGDNVLMLLPNFRADDDEQRINEAVMESANDIFEMEGLIRQFIDEHPDTPFLISKGSITECIQELERRIALYNGDFDKFIDDSDEFDKWRQVVYMCDTDRSEGCIITAHHEGWRAVLKAMES